MAPRRAPAAAARRDSQSAGPAQPDAAGREPIASLDPDAGAGAGVPTLLRELARDHGLSVLCSLHQPDLARRYADRVITLDGTLGPG